MTNKDKTFYEKLICLQNELKVPKGQYNNFGKYKYRSSEDILQAVKPILKKYELFLKLSDKVKYLGEKRFYIVAMATLSDGKNKINAIGYAREPEIKKGMDESQITGSCSSYARKYALNGLFCLDETESDPDSSEEQNIKEKPKKTIEEYFNKVLTQYNIKKDLAESLLSEVKKIENRDEKINFAGACRKIIEGEGASKEEKESALEKILLND